MTASAIRVMGERPSKLRRPDHPVLTEPSPELDLLPLGVCFCDRDGVIVRYNRSAVALWRQNPVPGELADDFLARLARPIPDRSLAVLPQRPVGSVLSGGGSVRDLETVMGRDDGSCVVVRVDVDSVLDELGALAGAVICFREVAGARHTQTRPDEAERRARSLLAELPVAVYTTDAAGRISFYNQAAVELWGREPELGVDVWCGSHVLRWPDGRPMRHDECPMAQALRERRAIRGAEAIAERPDGRQIHFLAYPTPVRDERGELTGAINTLVDITERQRSEEVAQRLASIVDSSNDAIISKNLDGVITSWNHGAERLFGYTAAEVIGEPITVLMPPDRRDEGWEILKRIRRGERVGNYDTVRQRKDGSPVEISLTVSPVRNAHGAIVGASKIAHDITERRRADSKQQLLLREMGHRIKNLFALASGVVTLSARFARTPDELAEAVRARLSALAQAHDLTLPEPGGAGERADRHTTLDQLVRTIVSPYSDPTRDSEARVVVRGPDVRVSGAGTSSLALLIHELATNAAKYGALSAPAGQVEVTWTIVGDELHLVWRERGGPKVDGRQLTEGFGTFLGRATVKGQLAGTMSREWEADGLSVRLSAALKRLAT